MNPANLAKHSISGIAWTMLRVFGQAGIGFGVGIFLARTLEIKDFGLMAIAMTLIGLAELISSLGVEASLIQRQQLTRKHLEVAFSLSLIMATVLLLMFCLLGPALAAFFDQPELVYMLPILGVGQLFATVGMVPRAALRRRFDFKLLSKIELGAYLLGYASLSVILVLLDFGVWSLVISTCAWFFLSSMLMFHSAKLCLRPSWGKQEVHDLLGFGLLMTSKSAINYAAVASTNFIVGKSMGTQDLGFFARAEQVAMLPLQKIASTFSSVMFPIYSSLQGDKELLSKAYLKTSAAVCLLTAPPLVIVSIFSEIVIVGLYGEKWAPASDVLSVLCLSSILVCLFHLAGALVEATNHLWAEIRRQVSYVVIKISMLYFAVQLGLIEVSFAVLFSALFLFFVMGQLSLKIIDKGWSDYIKALAPGLGVSSTMAVVAFLAIPQVNQFQSSSYSLKLLLIITVSGLVYFSLLYLMPDRWVFGAKQMILDKIFKRPSPAPGNEV